ncbi:MAG: DUF1460 domain-containing protein [Verrucomicrobiaceae bacterium]|nr:DUF1460 domain-containing protein [Verrucomicrobiaceae bacterium]
MRWLITALIFSISIARAELPFSTVFKGEDKFNKLVALAKPKARDLKALPIGDRVVWFGQALVGTPYKGFTLEIDDRVEAPSVNLDGLDCWTFFEVSLAFARMMDLDPPRWTPAQLLYFIEVDRYWNGKCTGSYLSRLHYLEDWARDNERRGYVKDLTRRLGAMNVSNAATEMTNNASGYRYMKNSAENRAGIAKLEAGLRGRPLPMIPLRNIASIESQLRNGDIISIVSRDGSAFGTSHVGLILIQNGVPHFMHASAPRNYGKVVIDSRLSEYVARYKTNAGIMVARPLK